jgi:hypothetical protein
LVFLILNVAALIDVKTSNVIVHKQGDQMSL